MVTKEFHTFQVWRNGSMLSTATDIDEKIAFCVALERAVPFVDIGDEVLIRYVNDDVVKKEVMTPFRKPEDVIDG